MGTVSQHVKLTHGVIIKAPGLLPMEYKLGEIAEKLGINPRTLADWTDAGAPHRHDSRGHIWIVGTEFAQWVDELRQKHIEEKNKRKCNDNQAYCMKCKKVVDLQNPTIEPRGGKLIFFKGKCPNCGNIINRGGRQE